MAIASDAAKLFRGSVPPSFVTQELSLRKNYKHTLRVDEKAILRYRKSRRGQLDFELQGIKKRELFGWIEMESERVGAIEIHEFRADDYLDNDTFFELMDAVSQMNMQLATAVIGAWEDVGMDLFAYGDIVDFRMAWTDPRRCPPGVWASLANALIELECSAYCLLTLKAFPLEYEGKVNGDAHLAASLKHRQGAMRRLYGKLLGVAPFPADNEWMYRINPRLASAIDTPQAVDQVA